MGVFLFSAITHLFLAIEKNIGYSLRVNTNLYFMETSAPIARSEIFELPHIGQDKLKNMKELISRQNFPEKKKLMIEVFNSLQK